MWLNFLGQGSLGAVPNLQVCFNTLVSLSEMIVKNISRFPCLEHNNYSAEACHASKHI